MERKTGLWTARAQARQKWLERALTEPASGVDDTAWRVEWITRALDVVKRAQEAVKYQAALTDIYAEHLSVLEMTLIAAAERNPSPQSDVERR